MYNIDDYRIVHYYSEDDDCFLATIPELPGCIADGNTVAEAVENVRELAKDWIDIATEYEEPIPEPSLTEYPSGTVVCIFDVAAYILQQRGPITAKALQKLLFYCKAWSLGWFDTPLFSEPFEAWKEGPMNRALYYKHAHNRMVTASLFRNDQIHPLSDEQKHFVDMILKAYESINADALGEMTHKEDPWRNARGSLPPYARCDIPISDADMKSYYGQAAHRP